MQNTNMKASEILAIQEYQENMRKFNRGEIQVMQSPRFGGTGKMLKKLALQFKEKEMMKDNNSRENHKRGLDKRVANYATQQTLNTMSYSPMRLELAKKQKFFGTWLNVLGLK